MGMIVTSLRAEYVYLDRRLQMITESCYSCGELFAMVADKRQKLIDSGDWFYCPNGHRQKYTGPTKEQQLERRLANTEESARIAWANEQQAREEAKAANRRAGAARGQLTKLRNRIANGVCPCCTRSFQNVHRHINSKHPEWAAEHAEVLTKS